jgi:hypothetical protein
MRTYRTSSLLAGLAAALSVTALAAVPATAGAATAGAATAAAAAGAASPRHAPPVGRQLAVLNGSGADRYFGDAVAMSGSTAVVGDGVRSTTHLGRVYVFSKAKSGWKQTAEVKEAGASSNGFGFSVAISGTTLVVGAPDALDFNGEAFVYAKTAAGWKQAAVLKEPDPVFEGDDAFGTSVGVSGTAIVVGAPGHQHGTGFGEAFMFGRTSAGWKQTAELKGAGANDDSFGGSVAISGTTEVIGAPNAFISAGRAFVFAKTAAGWKQTAQLKGAAGGSGVGGSGALFGEAVAISGPTVAVGEPQRAPGISGRVHVFARTASGWKQAATLKDGPSGTELGHWLALSGTTLVTNRAENGAFVFARKAARWKPVATLNHPGVTGSTVAIAGSIAIVGVVGTTQRGHVYVYQA